jgi:hypothetical protein
MFYMASRDFAQEQFLTYGHETTTPIAILFLYIHVKGPPLQKSYLLKRRN